MPKKYFARFSRIVALFVLENSEKTVAYNVKLFKEILLGFQRTCFRIF